MFELSISLRPTQDQEEIQLPEIQIEGIDANSSLEFLIRCLKGNYVNFLEVNKAVYYPPVENEALARRNFFSSKSSYTAGLELSEQQFQVLCRCIAGSTRLTFMTIFEGGWPDDLSAIRFIKRKDQCHFTAEEAQVLLTAVAENPSITTVMYNGVSLEIEHAIQTAQAIRPTLRGRISLRAQVAEDPLDDSTPASQPDDAVSVPKPVVSMHILQGFIAVLGAAAVASALLLLGAAALNPVGLAVAASGTVAVAWGAHSFFASSPKPDTGSMLSPSLAHF